MWNNNNWTMITTFLIQLSCSCSRLLCDRFDTTIEMNGTAQTMPEILAFGNCMCVCVWICLFLLLDEIYWNTCMWYMWHHSKINCNGNRVTCILWRENRREKNDRQLIGHWAETNWKCGEHIHSNQRNTFEFIVRRQSDITESGPISCHDDIRCTLFNRKHKNQAATSFFYIDRPSERTQAHTNSSQQMNWPIYRFDRKCP